MGHRLSKLKNSLCQNVHGHNFILEVTVKSEKLNQNDMVIDFSDLKRLVNSIIDTWDHGMFLNQNDELVNTKVTEYCKIHYTDNDPTAEVLCKFLFDVCKKKGFLPEGVLVDKISLWETSTSKSEYKEE